MVDGTAPAARHIGAALRCVGQCHASGVLLRIAAFLVLVAVLFVGPFAGEARAHGLHAGLSVQMTANMTQGTVSQDKAEAVSAQVLCSVKCCSATGCVVAAAVLTDTHPCIVVVATDDSFALPAHTAPKPSPQGTLKRPPRA